MAITRWHRQTKCTVHAKPPNKSCLLQTVAAKHTWPLHKAGPCTTHLKPELLGLQGLAKKRFIFSPPHQPLQVGRSFSFFYNTGNLHALFPTHATTVTQARNTLSQWPIKKIKLQAMPIFLWHVRPILKISARCSAVYFSLSMKQNKWWNKRKTFFPGWEMGNKFSASYSDSSPAGMVNFESAG